MNVRILTGDALTVLRTLESESVQVCVTSPPYLGLRSYGTDPQVWGGDSEHDHAWGDEGRSGQRLRNGQSASPLFHNGPKKEITLHPSTGSVCPCGAWRGELGSEPSPALFIEHLVMIFEEVKRVMRPDACLFVNLSDSYSGSGKGPTGANGIGDQGKRQGFTDAYRSEHVPAKSLYLIPERFAIAMQDAGWWVRSRIAWCKTSAMPESVRDRPTSAWEHIWMFTKSRTYYWDATAVAQPSKSTAPSGNGYARPERKSVDGIHAGSSEPWQVQPTSALRNFWLLGPSPSSEAHFATFPPEIPRRCIKAATSEKGACPACGAPWVRVVERESNWQQRKANGGGSGSLVNGHNASHGIGMSQDLDSVSVRFRGWQPSCPCDAGDPVPCVVLDPFLGSGTTLLVASRLGRGGVGIELSSDYARMAEERIQRDVGPMFPDEVQTVAATQASMFDSIEVAG